MKHHIWDETYREKLSAPFIRVVIEVFFFSLIGIVFGFAIALLLPQFTENEAWYTSLAYLLLELLVDAIVIYAVMTAYFMLFGVDADSFIGLTVFGNVFFLIQYSLAQRLQNVFTSYTQVELQNNVQIMHPLKRPAPPPASSKPRQLGEYEFVTGQPEPSEPSNP
jgi:hypothetical protein